MEPGSPNAPVTEDGHTFPINQTSYSVQLDQVLTTLQGDVRADLQIFLDQLGNALIKHGGAEGFRELYRTSAPAGKFTSQVNQAVLGTEPGDLSGLIRSLDRVVRGARPQRGDAAEPGHQLPRLLRLVRGRGRGPRAGDRGAARTRSRRRAGVREPERARSRRCARSRARRCPGVALDPGDAARGDPVRGPDPRRWSPSASCAAWSPTCVRRSRSWRSSPGARVAVPRTSRGRSPPASTRS